MVVVIVEIRKKNIVFFLFLLIPLIYISLEFKNSGLLQVFFLFDRLENLRNVFEMLEHFSK